MQRFLVLEVCASRKLHGKLKWGFGGYAPKKIAGTGLVIRQTFLAAGKRAKWYFRAFGKNPLKWYCVFLFVSILLILGSNIQPFSEGGGFQDNK
jgi:hypothetical protein